MDHFNNLYSNFWAGIAVHNGASDPMKIAEYDTPMSALVGGSYPSAVVDRTNVIDPSEMETESMQSALLPLGEFVSSIGMDRPFSQYTKAEVLRLIEVVIDAYQTSMLSKHEEQAERERIYFERIAERQSRQ